MNLKRRHFINAALLGAGGTFLLNRLSDVPLLGGSLSQRTTTPFIMGDAYHMIADAIRGGKSLFRYHEALAQDSQRDWSVVTIKVADSVFAPLVFRFEKEGPSQLDSDSISGRAKNHLLQTGASELSDNERWARLKFNKWFANMLQNGTHDGLEASTGNLLGVPQSEVGPFPEDVAMQVALQLKQISGAAVHRMKNFMLTDVEPDLARFVEKNKIVHSPLGMTCFNMGKSYDAAGGVPFNIICEDATESFSIGGRTVKEFVGNIKQASKGGYGDYNEGASNLTLAFDKLVLEDTSLRNKLLESRETFIAALNALEETAELEERLQTFDAALGNGQVRDGNNQGATGEFLSQCLFTARALQLEGLPLRNFSLFLNIVDLDGQSLDSLNRNGGNSDLSSFTYIEGMRQLAMGLNILAQVISKKNKKVIVQVISEGGRSRTLTDATVSFGFVMGPAGNGLLTDALYGNQNALEGSSSSLISNFGVEPSNREELIWSEGLVDSSGSPISESVNTGNLQAGVVEFLQSQVGTGVDLKSLGNRVKLKRG